MAHANVTKQEKECTFSETQKKRERGDGSDEEVVVEHDVVGWSAA